MLAGAAVIWGLSSACTSKLAAHVAGRWSWLCLESHLGLLIVALSSHSGGYSVWLGLLSWLGGWVLRDGVPEQKLREEKSVICPSLEGLSSEVPCAFPLHSVGQSTQRVSSREAATLHGRSSLCSQGGGESGGASVETMETSQQRSLLSAHRDFFLCYLAYQDILVLFGCS